MTFGLSGLWIVAGLAGIAGALYLLQRLRVRHREVPVVTTMFWKQAVEETRARVLVQRFRHLPAYLFLLAIASLLWLGFANPRSDGREGAPTVLLLDASAGMAEGERFGDAKASLLDEVRGIAADRRQVLYCGGRVRTLLAPGENVLLLEQRLAGLEPEEAPSSLARVARALKREHADVVIRVHGEPAAVPTPDAFGIAPAASGAWDKVDLLIQPAPRATGGTDGWPSLDGRRLLGQDNSFDGGSERTGLWPDVPADGGVVRVTYRGREHRMRLPTRKATRVGFHPDEEPAFRALLGAVLRADPGIEVAAEGEDYEVPVSSVMDPGPNPGLRFWDGLDATVVVRLDGASAPQQLQRMVSDLGLAEIDGAAVAEALGRPVVVRGEEPWPRGGIAPFFGAVRVDAGLLDPKVGFVRTRAFALLVAGAIRQLAGAPSVPPYVAAGEPVDGIPGTLGVPFTPPVAGAYTVGGRTIEASLQPDPEARPFRGAAASAVERSGAWPLARWLGLLALTLLAVEWWLYRKGRLP